MNNIPLKKKKLREIQRVMLLDLPGTEFVRAGRLIAHHIRLWLKENEFRIQHNNVALFRSMRDELNIEDLRAMLVERQFQLFYPCTSSSQPVMRFAAKRGDQVLELALEKMDLVFVPGRAFDRAGRRLGRGQGLYDKTLTTIRNSPSCPLFIGLALDSQVIEQVPAEPHDVLMNFICTPTLGMLQTSE